MRWNSHGCGVDQQSCRRHYRQYLRVKELQELVCWLKVVVSLLWFVIFNTCRGSIKL